jgi:hypothetical protein
MARTGTTIWLVLGIGVAILLVLGLIYGPDLYRKGESIVAPIMELTKSEEAIEALNADLPFTEPEDGLATEERLTAVLEIRRQLKPHYEEWMAVQRQIERRGQEDFEAAGAVLDKVSDLYNTQIDVLRANEMSQNEFRWYETSVYDEWLTAVEAAEWSSAQLAAASEIREMTEADLAFVDELRSRHGTSKALDTVQERLNERMAALDDPPAPELEGVPAGNSELYWRHREAIAELTLAEHDEMHRRLRLEKNPGVNIKINRSKSDEKD